MSDEAKKLAKIAVASLVALSVTTPASSEAAKSPTENYVKCYGVAAANKNDCGTTLSACAATIPTPGACYAWIYTPKDICEKLANASLNAPAKNCQAPKAPKA